MTKKKTAKQGSVCRITLLAAIAIEQNNQMIYRSNRNVHISMSGLRIARARHFI
jgi:hypothetical protein